MIEIENLSKTFAKGDELVEAVRDVDLAIAAREIVAVIGPSGCGKSTLLNMIAGLYPPTRGRIVYRGAAVADVNPTAATFRTDTEHVLLDWFLGTDDGVRCSGRRTSLPCRDA